MSISKVRFCVCRIYGSRVFHSYVAEANFAPRFASMSPYLSTLSSSIKLIIYISIHSFFIFCISFVLQVRGCWLNMVFFRVPKFVFGCMLYKNSIKTKKRKRKIKKGGK